MAVKTYAPSEVAVIVNGIPLTNFESVKVSYDNDRFTFSEGSGGEVTRVKSASKLGTIELEFPQTASANAILAGKDALTAEAILAAMLPFKITAFNDTLFTIFIQDTKGFSEHIMTEASLVKSPDADYSKSDATTRTWQFKGALDRHWVAGN